MPFGRNRCPDGMDLNTALAFCVKPDFKCKVQTTTCYKWVTCSVGGPDDDVRVAPALSPPVLLRLQVSVNRLRNGCDELHARANVVCCQYEC